MMIKRTSGAEKSGMKDAGGLTIIELMVVLAIFSVVMAGLYSAYTVQMRTGVKEYRIAELDMELQIAKSVIERDVAMAGFGVLFNEGMKGYCGGADPAVDATCDSKLKCTNTSPDFCLPVPVSATNGSASTYDTLTLMGMMIGRGSRAAQSWSYLDTPASFRSWDDARERILPNDRVVFASPARNEVLFKASAPPETQRDWLFPASLTSLPDNSQMYDLAYGMHTASDVTEAAKLPYYVVRYSLGGTPPTTCAPGTLNLERGESRSNSVPTGGEVTPLLACVLDFQVALGWDTSDPYDKIPSTDCWDNGGVLAAGIHPDYNKDLARRLTQVKAYVLVQQGGRDPNYTAPEEIRVGDLNLTACGGGGAGRSFSLNSEQRKYKWKLVTISVKPRSLF